jgi:tRNA(Ile)-lysidine synthase
MSSGAQLRRAKYKPMLQAFLDYIKYQHLIEKGKRSLLAISGGLDSMVMLHLFHQAGLECGVAHCNFSLRGDASDADEQLVVATAEKLSLPIYTKRFDTEKEAAKKGLSIQMAARELRYNWFKTLLDKEQYDYIATAHHLNDNIETLFPEPGQRYRHKRPARHFTPKWPHYPALIICDKSRTGGLSTKT